LDLITFYIARSLYIARLRRYRKAAMRVAVNGDLLVPRRRSVCIGCGTGKLAIWIAIGEDTVTQRSRFISAEAAYRAGFLRREGASHEASRSRPRSVR
jgi:hypothetical protein